MPPLSRRESRTAPRSVADAAPILSLVVVCYEMARELPRTLPSLSPPYQRGVLGDEIEIILVDNGSEHRPQPEDFAGLAATLAVCSCSRPTPSPARAINEGLARARGDLIGVWIDGARMASPGLLRACLDASRLHPRPVIATQNYQLGFVRQAIGAEHGYDQETEDRLLREIGWPMDGYRLFEIATPEISSPTAPMLESNALFLPRRLWNELDGYDENFLSPGGGLANPDVFVRAVSLPDVQLVRILGEGTFHQTHGGRTTAGLRATLDYVKQASREYRALRGRPLAPVRSIGWLYHSAQRSTQPMTLGAGPPS